MKMIKSLAAMCVAAVCTCALGDGEPAAATLNRIPGTDSIDIPQGITDKQALDAVEQAVKGTKAGDTRNYWLSQWRMEARDPANKWIQIGLTARQHYLCVCYRIENGKLVPDVPTSTNLKQEGTKIHRKVPAWINNLKPLISSRFYEMSNGSGTVAPSAPAGAQAATPKESASAFCKFCGKKADADANFCSGCGKKLQ